VADLDAHASQVSENVLGPRFERERVLLKTIELWASRAG